MEVLNQFEAKWVCKKKDWPMLTFLQIVKSRGLHMKCSSMVSVAAFNPGDSGSNPDWFAVSNSN